MTAIVKKAKQLSYGFEAMAELKVEDNTWAGSMDSRDFVDLMQMDWSQLKNSEAKRYDSTCEEEEGGEGGARGGAGERRARGARPSERGAPARRGARAGSRWTSRCSG